VSVKVFLSHSTTDEPMASALVDCLLSSMVLEDSELRCTSVPGHKLPVGSDFAATLLEDIGDSSVVIGLITKSALSSSWVLFELGATWGSKKN
jgi:TIR domain